MYKEVVTSGPREFADLLPALVAWRSVDLRMSADRERAQGRLVYEVRGPIVAVSFCAAGDVSYAGGMYKAVRPLVAKWPPIAPPPAPTP